MTPPPPPPPPTVPQRTIAVRVDTQPSRLSPRSPVAAGPGAYPHRGGADLAAVQPQDEATGGPARGGTTRPATRAWPDPPLPGEVACPRCGRGMAPERRFCRCGATLGTARPSAPTPAPVSRRPPWYRRLGELAGGGREFRRAMRAANGGARAAYDVSLAARARVVRTVLALGALGIGVSQFGPWGSDLRDQVYQRVDRVLPHRYATVAVDTVTTDPAVREIADFAADYLTDGNASRAWAQRWMPPAAGGQPCRRPAGAPALLVSFRHEARIERIVFRAGLAKDNSQRPLQFRPRRVDIQFADGTCQVADLQDKPEPQEVRVTVPAGTHARVSIVDVYPPSDQGDGLVALSELSFDARA